MSITLKLSVLIRHPGVQVRDLGDNSFLVEFDGASWVLWAKASSWVEVAEGRPRDRLGEIHYGPVASFYRKNILRLPSLPKNHGKRWDDDEISDLYELIEKDIAIGDVAKQLGRSVSSVVAKTAQLLGLDLAHLDGDKALTDLTFRGLIESELIP